MDSKFQVFISSTFNDLKTERQAAVESILKAGHIPAGMELFTAGDKSQWEIIQRWINEADIYMLILGGRYGTVEKKSGLSYTELEYNYAVSLKKPHFAVVIKDEALEEKVRSSGTDMIEMENPAKLKKFKKMALSKMSSFYSDPRDIKLAVMESVAQLARDHKITGWVRSETVPDVSSITKEMARLQSENSKLRAASERLAASKSKNESEESDFDSLIDLLSRIKLDFSQIKASFDDGDKADNEKDAFSCILLFKDVLLRGPSNLRSNSDQNKWCFFNLCPILQTHEMMVIKDGQKGLYRRYEMIPRGLRFLAYIAKMSHSAPP